MRAGGMPNERLLGDFPLLLRSGDCSPDGWVSQRLAGSIPSPVWGVKGIFDWGIVSAEKRGGSYGFRKPSSRSCGVMMFVASSVLDMTLTLLLLQGLQLEETFLSGKLSSRLKCWYSLMLCKIKEVYGVFIYHNYLLHKCRNAFDWTQLVLFGPLLHDNGKLIENSVSWAGAHCAVLDFCDRVLEVNQASKH